MLILVDETVMDELQDNRQILRQTIDKAIRDLNHIYQSTIFTKKFDDLYFYIKRVVLLKNFIPKCKDGNVS